MKLFFISDIHGSEFYLKKAIEKYLEEKADYIVILGDILYHGARNPLPKGHNPKGVIEILNSYSDKIIAVRGNCDSEVDEMVLAFPIMSTYSNILYGNKRLVLTHGHIYNEENLLPLTKGDVFIYGHTHLPRAEEIDGLYFLNPGSIALPKENNPHSYGVLSNNIFQVKNLEGNIIKEINIK